VEEHRETNEVYSKRVKAGKRTYFFDVKATRANDYYLTITESRKKFKEDKQVYEKHKIFLYKEDLNKFIGALSETVEHIKKELIPDYDFDQFEGKDDEEYPLNNAAN
jgi:Protein of unknown function (DUF3276)